MNTMKLNLIATLVTTMSLLACRETKERVPNPSFHSHTEKLPISLSETDHTITLSEGFEEFTTNDVYTNTDRENFAAACGVKVEAGTYSYASEKKDEKIRIISITGLDPVNGDNNFTLNFNHLDGPVARINRETAAYTSSIWIEQNIHLDADGKLSGTLNFTCHAYKK